MKQWLMNQVEGSASLQAILSAFNSLSQSKQRLVIIALIVILFWLAIKLVFTPYYNDYQKASNRLANATSNYLLLAKHASDIASTEDAGVDYLDRNSAELRVIVNTSIKRTKLAPEVISREGQSRLRVGISEAPYEMVAQWLNLLAQQKVKINSMQIQALSPGVVSLSISLD
ncbi:type II secretion system protein GspM [Marinomonas transparens]|uniref:Type II secretion system protein M n=1 Tax=Marinomonas transparens TaxID=2795388 RepID=A0A934JQX9_9GAMM|nr:type II secretion system protein GspM [Marinomonas transparens]MBJ7539053.1 type II secretion system protein M [Marinomonas transparens]